MIPLNLSPVYTDVGSSLSGTGMAGEQRQIRTGPKTGFQLRRLSVRHEVGSDPPNSVGRPYKQKKRDLMTGPVFAVWKLMPLMGLLTATEKQMHLGWLHMRPRQ